MLGAVETCEVNAQLVSKERGEDFSYIEVKANIYLDKCLDFAFFSPPGASETLDRAIKMLNQKEIDWKEREKLILRHMK